MNGSNVLGDTINTILTEAGVELPEPTRDSDPFDAEYPIEEPKTYSYVLEQTDEIVADMFLKYSRLLKAYLADRDSRYVMDVLIQGLSHNTFYKANASFVVSDLMTRSSQIRAVAIKTNGVPSKVILERFGTLSEIWAAEDVLKIYYGHFLPAEVAAELMNMQENLSGGSGIDSNTG